MGGRFDLKKEKFLLALQHPVTTEYGQNRVHMKETLMALNKLKMPKIVRDAKDEADQLILAGLKMYADPSGDFKAFVPRSWMDETIKRLSAVE